ncbi:hypothetical protein EV361DRAFT_231388 [Lentinula raphanica]|nr:hypothetical protein EV361DRAFT_231388 [Lentinula raphanica]
MAKKKNKQIILPWCWYCEREFEDEKVLMQHQKAKHFKCNMCPRRLNTAGGLAVHIQQVHKLEPENLPRIENALPGRDGYEVEIFGMEGIPAPDVADYKRRKEIELGLAAGSISQPPAKRPRTENRPLSEDELKAALEAHRALMGAANDTAVPAPNDQGAVYGAPPQTYTAPPAPAPVMPGPPPPGMMPPGAPAPGAPPFFPPPPGMAAGQPPFAPFPGMPGFPPGICHSTWVLTSSGYDATGCFPSTSRDDSSRRSWSSWASSHAPCAYLCSATARLGFSSSSSRHLTSASNKRNICYPATTVVVGYSHTSACR